MYSLKMTKEPQNTEHGLRVGDVELIWARNSKTFFFSNSILIHDGKPTLVDPSANFSYLEQLASKKQVQQVLNTHYHLDHRSLNGLFPHATLMCHKLDQKALTSFENYLKYADPEGDSSYVQWLKGIFASLGIKETYVSILLKDGDKLPLTGQEVQVIHLPGHTPGHMGLFFKDIDLLFSADVDLTPLGPWYANVSSNMEDFMQSLKRLRDIECQYYTTSHGSRLYDREKFLEKLDRFESAFNTRDEKLLEALKEKPRNLAELSLIGIIYKQSHLQKDPLKASFERQMLIKHIERLEKLGMVRNEGGVWHLV